METIRLSGKERRALLSFFKRTKVSLSKYKDPIVPLDLPGRISDMIKDLDSNAKVSLGELQKLIDAINNFL